MIIRKLAAVILSILLFTAAFAPAISGDSPADSNKPVSIVKISFAVGSNVLKINNSEVTVRRPYLVNDTILVPVRVITEAFGSRVDWEASNQEVTITYNGTTIKLWIGSKTATVNGAEKELLAAPELNVDTTMVPLRFISETFGADVTYEQAGEQIHVVKRIISGAAQISPKLLEGAKTQILTKTKRLGNRAGAQFPEGTKDGEYVLKENPGWTAGFYPGINYLCYDMSGDESYLQVARSASEVIKEAFDKNKQVFSHDVGFVFMDSFYKEYLQSGSEEAKAMVIRGGDALLERVKPEGYIQAWDIWGRSEFGQENRYRMIADTMCNLPLLFTCAELTGDTKYTDAAIKHAQMTQQYIIRPDHTTAHTFVFNPDGSKYERTHQGFSDGSCWARGQAWVINGMAKSYLATGDESFLESAKNCADVFFEMTEDDLIPRWDLSLKGMVNEPRDTSAASIMACGLMDIYEATGDEFYKNAAYLIFKTLYESYTTNMLDEGIVGQAVGNKPGGKFINCSLIYGDYYFAELTKRFLDLQS